MPIEFDAVGDFQPLQYEDEIGPFIDLLKAEGVRSYIEVGACYGGTFHRVMSSLPNGSKGTTVDLPAQRWGMPDSEPRLLEVMTDLSAKGYEVGAVWGDSKALDTYSRAKERGPYDALMIDGDHTYEGVRSDWLTYGHLAKVVAFHDIAAMKGKRFGVRKLWLELREHYRHVEFIRPRGKLGIGVLWNV